MKILIAEDQIEISNLVKLYLEKENYDLVVASDGIEAYNILKNEDIDLAIVDVMMPRLDGFSLVQKARLITKIPIIMLTAKQMVHDKILGLDLGADDYITKPFDPLELVSRVNAHIRRNYSYNEHQTTLKYDDLLIDRNKCEVLNNEKNCMLTAMEFKILNLLITQPGRVFTKRQIYTAIRENYCYLNGDENTIIVHMCNLRDKIENDSKNPKYIKTVRGLGYKIEKL